MAAPHDAQFSAHTAADLLRQSLMHGKPHEEEHEHIASGASTPPNGTATPRPDLHVDKRLPGIVNSYFAQVRDSLRIRSSKNAHANPSTPVNHTSTPTSEQDEKKKEPRSIDEPPAQNGDPLSFLRLSSLRVHDGGHVAGTTSAAPSPPPSAPAGRPHESPPLSPRGVSPNPDLTHMPCHRHEPDPKASYPTPPLSNSSSFLALTSDAPSIAWAAAESHSSRKRSWAQRRKSLGPIPAQLRRHTLGNAIAGVVAKPAVSAHIPNPAVALPSPDTAPSIPSVEPVPSTPETSNPEESRVLTPGDRQNTPPQTPRTGSYVTRSRDDDGSLVPKSHKIVRTTSSGGVDSPTIGNLKGQLEISIEEARGLRPSVDPYVVCIFQLNEDISGGPKEDEMDTRGDGGSPAEENLAKGVAMKRLGSGSGTPMAIPGLRSRQTSQTNMVDMRRGASKQGHQETTDPIWRHTATFDVVGENSEVGISVYDRANNEAFIGHVRLSLNLDDYEHQHEDWYKLEPRDGQQDKVTGEIHLKIGFHASGKKAFGPDDFEILKLIGKGTFGQVFQVRKRDTKRIYAMKVLSKKVIVQKKEIQHTIGERNILVRTATTESPFIVGLKFSFQTSADLYLVTDYMSGGELFWHLQKEGRFVEERAKFYIAELILALRHLHQHDIVYRDLKPENILLDANGHIALCDFGLSKANLAQNDTTNTFCGTTEYLAPEVLLDEQGYTKMVDFWSLGVLVFEMCCGWSPFYAEDTQQMYKNIAFGKVRFPRDALSQEGRNFVKGLLNRNPSHRLGAKGDAEELMAHPFFSDVDWTALSKKLTPPPFKPKLKGELDTSNFDPEFTNALAAGSANSLNARAAALASGINTDGTPLSPTMQNQFKGFTFVDESTLEQQYVDRDEDLDSMEGIDGGNTSRTPHGRQDERMGGLESSNEDPEFGHGTLDDI